MITIEKNREGWIKPLAKHISDKDIFSNVYKDCNDRLWLDKTGYKEGLFIGYNLYTNKFDSLDAEEWTSSNLDDYGYILSLTSKGISTTDLWNNPDAVEDIRTCVKGDISKYYKYTLNNKNNYLSDMLLEHKISWSELPARDLVDVITNSFEDDKNIKYYITPEIKKEMIRIGRYGRYPENIEEVKLEILSESWKTATKKHLLQTLPAKLFTDDEYQNAILDGWNLAETDIEKRLLLRNLKKRSVKHFKLFIVNNNLEPFWWEDL